MNILGIDTATDLLTVSLSYEGLYYENYREVGLKHAETLMPRIQSIMDESGASLSDLDLMVCTEGPGSFTGLRIGMSTLKGLSAGSGVPMVSVPTLDLFAAGRTSFEGSVISAVDARKKRYYAGIYKEGNLIQGPLDISTEELMKLLEDSKDPVLVTGPDAEKLCREAEKSGWILDPEARRPVGKALLTAGETRFKKDGADPDAKGPIYLRKSEAEIQRENP